MHWVGSFKHEEIFNYYWHDKLKLDYIWCGIFAGFYGLTQKNTGGCCWVCNWVSENVHRRPCRTVSQIFEDSQDKDQWRLRMKVSTSKPKFTPKMTVKMECLCVPPLSHVPLTPFTVRYHFPLQHNDSHI